MVSDAIDAMVWWPLAKSIEDVKRKNKGGKLFDLYEVFFTHQTATEILSAGKVLDFR